MLFRSLAVFGDDHGGKSSTISHQSDPAMAANGVPVLYPASVQEILDYGLHGWALSRFAGVWVGLKTVNEIIEATATVDGSVERVQARIPDVQEPPGGVSVRAGLDPLGDEIRLMRHKLPRVHAYVRANRLDRVTHGTGVEAEWGLIAAGKTWLDTVSALDLLGLNDEAALRRYRVQLYKPALVTPLEPEGLVEFASGLREVMGVEEKAAFLEPQVPRILYGLDASRRPALCGKHTPEGQLLLPSDMPLEPLQLALAMGSRLHALGLADEVLEQRIEVLRSQMAEAGSRHPVGRPRTPYFCSGCPHNTSTKGPEGSVAFGGIGCHTMAIFMDRHTLPPTQMGGEGANWIGMAPFTDLPHVFQNLGDGT